MRLYSDVSLRQRHEASAILPPFAIRSHFLPHTIPTASARHISFKELKAQRAKQRAAEEASQPPPPPEEAPSQPRANAAPHTDPEPASAPPPPPPKEPETADEAEAAFASARAEAERAWAKEQARQEKQRAKEATTEGEEGAAEGEESGDKANKKEEKKDEAPPPHGTKTPWQVFTETLQNEFKASKEWEESTKQLGGTIHDFTQNPNVVRARSAYSKAADAASTATGKAFLGTAGAIGRGAAWTWQTPVVKGIRHGAAAVGGVQKRQGHH